MYGGSVSQWGVGGCPTLNSATSIIFMIAATAASHMNFKVAFKDDIYSNTVFSNIISISFIAL